MAISGLRRTYLFRSYLALTSYVDLSLSWPRNRDQSTVISLFVTEFTAHHTSSTILSSQGFLEVVTTLIMLTTNFPDKSGLSQ